MRSTILRPEHFAAAVMPPTLVDQIQVLQGQDAFVRDHAKEKAPTPFTMREGLLYHRGRLYVPAGSCRDTVLRLCHDSRPAGHFGLYKTLHLLTREFWWPRVRADVAQYVQSCSVCRRAKVARGKPVGLLHPLATPAGPWRVISMDFITDLPLSAGHTAIFVVVDLFSKMAHFVPCVGLPTAKETARLFVHQVFRLHGLPEGIVSDRGAQFTARFWRSLLQVLDITAHMSSAYHPQTDGQTERTNGTLEQYLRCYTNYQQDDWSELLPVAEFAYNNAVHASTQQTPFFATGGFHPRGFPAVLPSTAVPAADQWLRELQAAQSLLREQLQVAKDAYKLGADRKRQEGPALKVGDQVWLSTRHLPLQRPCRKLDARFIGPYPVTAQVNPVAFRLQLPRTLRIHPVFHRSLLVPAAEVRPDARVTAPPVPVMVDGEEEFEVAQVLDSRRHRGRLQYLIDWLGYGPEERSWEDARDVHAPILVQAFHRQYPAKPGPPGMAEGDSRGGCSVRSSEELLGIDSEEEEVEPVPTEASVTAAEMGPAGREANLEKQGETEPSNSLPGCKPAGSVANTEDTEGEAIDLPAQLFRQHRAEKEARRRSMRIYTRRQHDKEHL